ncbi:uncharacterized protein LOC123875297 [Maniola jurtina]|uniref:uncharacterized protein LOC123875297 n=1 Tax=Maniola jurtina TaxID=191418 RepID=UPI001E689762|nr:uncharacterized protein LOC123875297 [Maniola jurtina]
MQSNFIWLFIIFYLLAVTSADHIRPKRDLARIQKIIRWLLGINEGKQTVPLIENQQQRIYTIPAYQKLLVRTIPRTEMNGNVRHLLTDGLYPEETFRPVQTIRNNYPIVYSKYPPAMQDYINDRAYEQYGYDRPMYPYINQVPSCDELVPPLCPVRGTKLTGEYETRRAIVTESRQPMPQPPMYIQDRLREAILNRPIPTVQVKEEIVVPPPSQRKVNVYEYSVLDDRMIKNKATPAKPNLTLQPETEVESQFKTNDNDIKKKVSFTTPVQTKFRYKMIYNNRPDRNTVVETDSSQTQTTKSNEETSTVPVSESTDQKSKPPPMTESLDKIPDDYVYIPPVSTETPPPGIPKVYSNMKQANSDNYSADASENRPIVSIDESPGTNAGNKEKPTRVVIRRRKLKSRPENSRGDIPEHSS